MRGGHLLTLPNLREGYHQLARWVLETGEQVAPRGQATREVLAATFEVEDLTQTMPIGCGRGVNPAIGALEALFLIGGFVDYDLVERVAPRFREFMDDGKLHGAYGARAHGLTPHIIRRLRGDASTRQAVLTLWHPEKDLTRDGLHDYPCTLTLHFMIRNDKLNLHVTMRSNDVWLGTSLDIFMFTQLQHTVANVLGIEVGRYFHTANSLHVYERDIPKVERMLDTIIEEPVWLPRGLFGAMDGSAEWVDIERQARAIAQGVRSPYADPHRQWYVDKLHPLLGGGGRDEGHE